MKTTSIEELYSVFKQHPIISKDSRNIKKNCLYFAIKGDNFDGNKFAIDAIQQGAAFAVVDNQDLANDPKMLFVEDTLVALQELANFHRNNFDIPVVAITGSNGKTTTKELIASVLTQKYKILVTEGNLNNHIGVPLTLLNLTSEHQLAIIEMGANHQGEIDRLCKIANPNLGLITNIGKSHLEGFGGIEGVKKGKSELYKYIEKNKGLIFINEDDAVLKELACKLKQISYGTCKADCIGKLEEIEPVVKGSWQYKNSNGAFESNLYGKYNFYNILAAICIGNHFELEGAKIDKGINEYASKINRSQLIEENGCKILLDAYNANPSSMKLALENLINTKASVRIAILGDMFELGEFSEEEHKNIVNFILKSTAIKKAILVGKNFYNQKVDSEKITFVKRTLEAKDYFKELTETKDILFLIKGSRGMAMEKVIA